MFGGRVRGATRRMFRRVPNRTDMDLVDARGEKRAEIDDCWNVNVSEQDTTAVATLRGWAQTWKLPVVNVPDDIEPKSSDRLQERESGRLWEIRTARLEAADCTWHCVCVELEQHEGAPIV